MIEPIGMRSHLLIRVAVDVRQEEWFGQKLPREEGVQVVKPGQSESGSGVSEEKRRGFLAGLGRMRERRQERKRRKNEERERIWKRQERQAALCQTEERIEKLSIEILEMTGGWENCFCVYEDTVRRALLGESGYHTGERAGGGNAARTWRDEKNAGTEEPFLPKVWGKYILPEEFDGYPGQLWVEELMPEAVLAHFVILGTAPCLPMIIEKYAGRMKSLRWIMWENDCDSEIQEFVEDFYTEYGLAIMLCLAPAGQKRLQAACVEPSNVLDFSHDARISLTKVAKGSIWLDMTSQEEKRRRVVGGSTGIVYFSLKEKWKLVRKKAPYMPGETL